ncbi:unnamed protein product [Calypogeia fissa]
MEVRDERRLVESGRDRREDRRRAQLPGSGQAETGQARPSGDGGGEGADGMGWDGMREGANGTVDDEDGGPRRQTVIHSALGYGYAELFHWLLLRQSMKTWTLFVYDVGSIRPSPYFSRDCAYLLQYNYLSWAPTTYYQHSQSSWSAKVTEPELTHKCYCNKRSKFTTFMKILN